MISFKIRDEIEHPKYGRGMIQKVTVVHDLLTVLDVKFVNGTFKQLNATWVEQNCKHIEYTAATTGMYCENSALSTEKWRILIEANTVLDEKSLEGLDYILKNVRPGINLALIGCCTVVAISADRGTTIEKIEKLAKRHMSEVFHTHPDFSYIGLPDQGVVITMQNDHLWTFIKPELVERNDNGSVAIQTMLAGRHVIMSECDERKVLAIIRGDGK